MPKTGPQNSTYAKIKIGIPHINPLIMKPKKVRISLKKCLCLCPFGVPFQEPRLGWPAVRFHQQRRRGGSLRRLEVAIAGGVVEALVLSR